MFDDELIAFLESGCSTIVGALTTSGEPFAARGWGIEVLGDRPPRIRTLVGAWDMATIGHHPSDGADFAIALTGTSVSTLRSVQLKGRARSIGPPTAADRQRADAYCDAFFDELLTSDNIPRALMDRLVPVDLVALTAEVTELYDQTPGPAAGTPLPRP